MKVRPKLPRNMAKPAPERRGQPRFEADLPVKLQILIPEETFSPQILTGILIEVSRNGMRVRIDKLARELYKNLFAETRYVRVLFANPKSGDEGRAVGKVIWIDYRQTKAKASSGECILGISLVETADTPADGYADLVQTIQAESPL